MCALKSPMSQVLSNTNFCLGGGLGPPCPPCSAPYALDFSYNTGIQLETDDLPLGKSYSSC